jgi:hypothetical protein
MRRIWLAMRALSILASGASLWSFDAMSSIAISFALSGTDKKFGVPFNSGLLMDPPLLG